MVLFVDRTTTAAHFMELCLTYLVTHSNNVATSLCISVVLASHLTRLELKFSFMCLRYDGPDFIYDGLRAASADRTSSQKG